MGSNKQMAIIVATVVVIGIVAATLFYSQKNNNGIGFQLSNREVIDSAKPQSAPSTTNVPSNSIDNTDVSNPQTETATNTTEAQYTGDNAYLNEIVPQMQIDIDKIYNSSSDISVVRRKVKRYYRGLRATLKDKTQEQLDAFDKAFAEYNNSKK